MASCVISSPGRRTAPWCCNPPGPQAVDTGHRSHDDHVPPFKERHGRRMAKPVDLLVHGRILFNIGIGGGDVRFRLVIIVVAHEIVHRVVREKILEFAGGLRGQRLIRRNDERRPLYLLDDLGHGKGLARSRCAEQDLRPLPFTEPLHQRGHRLRLIAHRLKRRLQGERRHVFRILSCDAGILHAAPPSPSFSAFSPYYNTRKQLFCTGSVYFIENFPFMEI